MATRWTPQRFITRRRWRIALVALVSLIVLISSFFVGVYKAVALTVNGKTSHVHTLAISVDGLLREQNVSVKTHDFVTSSSGDRLTNNSSVVVRTAYESKITIDGHEVSFWTYATSADQLLKLFKQNEKNAVKITVNISNIYNKLTGGFVINADGPVTVIADGKTTVAPDGKLTAASILDSQGINIGQHDRVSVEQDGNTTILRVVRITYSDSTREVSIPYSSVTVDDDTMDEGTTSVVQQGIAGTKTQYLRNTLADGTVESSEVTKEIVTRDPQDEIIHVGTKKPQTSESSQDSSSDNNSSQKDNSSSDSSSSQSQDQQQNQSNSDSDTQKSDAQKKAEAEKAKQEEAAKAQKAAEEAKAQKAREDAAKAQQQSGLWHPTVAQAKAYAQAAAAQYGWTGANWSALEWLWNRESGWRWNAENRSSGAYGIPQSLPGSKMAIYGANWRDDASIQINWGLNYIKNRYGSPLQAQDHSKRTGWY